MKTRFAGDGAARGTWCRAVFVSFALGLVSAVIGCQPGPSAGTNVLGATFTDAANTCAAPAEAEQYASRIVDLVNEERQMHGLRPLRINATLTRLSSDYACEMIEGDFFEHTDPVSGSTVGSRALQSGYYFKKVGENLAGGFASPEETMAQWMESPGHRANILDPDFVEMGAAVRIGGSYHWYWVQEFGLPR